MLRVLVSAALFAAFAPAFAFAQGGDGRPGAAHKKATNTRAGYRPKVKRAAPKIEPQPVKPVVPPLGTLSAVINESDSRVYLSVPANRDSSLVLVTPRRRSTFWRMLPPGRYALTVKKPGFFDEIRSVDVEPRGRHRLTIDLRPQMAILSVSTNLADAEIDIQNVGKFNGGLKKLLIDPGRYKINLKRRGYVSQTVTADLSVAGEEQNIYAVLQPLRIDTVLAQANELLAKGNLNAASLLVNDVLSMNPAHARANLLFSFIQLRRGDASAVGYFVKAISGGETATFPVKTVFSGDLVDVEIAIDRDAIAFRSKTRVDLNFEITRSKLDQMQRMTDENSSVYIAVRGESDFFGKGIRPNLKIYSGSAAIDPGSKQIVCSGAANGRSCAADLAILFETISRWRELPSISDSRGSR